MAHQHRHGRGPNEGEVSNREWGPYMEENGTKLPPGCYAYVGDPEVKNTWKLPHHEGAGGVDPDTGLFREVGRLNRNGVHAAAQRFEQTEFPSDEARSEAASHLRSAYEYMGEEPPEVIQEAAPLTDNRILRAAPLADVELSDERRDELLEIINSKHARRPLSAEQVYIFPGIPSTQAIDHYGTRMAPSSLENYVEDIKRGLAIMNSHRTGSFLNITPPELPLGRAFEAELQGEPIQVGEAGFDERTGAQLFSWGYLVPGIKLGEISSDDVIQGIETGIVDRLSIGFSEHPDGRFTCSVCGNDYLDYGACPHVAFVRYEDEETEEQQRAFVWVENAHIFEYSTVYAGATPGAHIPRAIEAKARAKANEIPGRELAWLEDHYEVRLGSTSIHRIKDKPTIPAATQGGAVQDNRLSEEEDINMDRDPIITLLQERGLSDESLGELQELEGSEFAERAVREAVGLADNRQEEIDQLKPDADFGKELRTELIDEAVKARVRAQGNDFDADKYREVLESSNDLAFIRQELTAWGGKADEILKRGPGDTREADDTAADNRAPAGAYS